MDASAAAAVDHNQAVLVAREQRTEAPARKSSPLSSSIIKINQIRRRRLKLFNLMENLRPVFIDAYAGIFSAFFGCAIFSAGRSSSLAGCRAARTRLQASEVALGPGREYEHEQRKKTTDDQTVPSLSLWRPL